MSLSFAEKMRMINAQQAQVPVHIRFAWDGVRLDNGEVSHMKNTRGEHVHTGAWYAQHLDGSITVRAHHNSDWEDYVIEKRMAMYMIPSNCVNLFKIGTKVRYIKSEGAINNYYGLHTIVAIKMIPVPHKSEIYALHMAYESMDMTYYTSMGQRSKSEEEHYKLLNDSFITSFNLCKPPWLSVSVDYERIILQPPENYNLGSYTPDFRIIMTKKSFMLGRIHVIVESKSSRAGLSEPKVNEKIQLVTDYHNMHILVMFGSPPIFKYIPKFTSDWKTANPDMNMDETIQLLLRLAEC
ncbi:hypothetical protein EPVG_00054 [Emiliania huxleyi virus 201]|nr:hypothetical protein ELVG_00224 [Emiliania huxleyi virus 203]AEP15600.1 hypothetical protein EQVG_00190 [Emiliania huxleyi virus 207]AEP16014.1 hypothetical protein ERVG_00137 [Emiliania huxleyi virus 208]AET97942.1 hypothetical protein EPVG_00054 [Emiliania huxleyi virus 201]